MRIYIEVCRVATGSNLRGLIRAIVVLRVLFLNLISFQKNATTRAVGEKNKSTQCFLSGPHDFPCCFANNCTTKIYCNLPANKHEREVWSSVLGLAKSIYKVFVRVCNLVVHIYFHSAIRENCGINDCGC